ncbi:hypothetical protein ACFL0Y_01855 [Patescibacteria group bacterium]
MPKKCDTLPGIGPGDLSRANLRRLKKMEQAMGAALGKEGVEFGHQPELFSLDPPETPDIVEPVDQEAGPKYVPPPKEIDDKIRRVLGMQPRKSE